MAEKALKETSGGEDRKNWFEEGGYPGSSKVERLNASNCIRNGVDPAISAKGTTSDRNCITTTIQ